MLYPTLLDVALPSDKEVVSVHVGARSGHLIFSMILFIHLELTMMESIQIGDELGEAVVLMAFEFNVSPSMAPSVNF